jgi:hypothetical protein
MSKTFRNTYYYNSPVDRLTSQIIQLSIFFQSLTWLRYQTASVVVLRKSILCRPSTAEARVRSRVYPCGICGGQSNTGRGFSPSTWVFPCQFHSTVLHYSEKWKKLIIFLFIFIAGLHNKPQGCGTSVASAAGPFITKKRAFCIFNADKWTTLNWYCIS